MPIYIIYTSYCQYLHLHHCKALWISVIKNKSSLSYRVYRKEIILSRLYAPSAALLELWHRAESWCARYQRDRACNVISDGAGTTEGSVARRNRFGYRVEAIARDRQRRGKKLERGTEKKEHTHTHVIESGAITGRVSALRVGSFRITARTERSVIAGRYLGTREIARLYERAIRR